jgi:hypothetical protein
MLKRPAPLAEKPLKGLDPPSADGGNQRKALLTDTL